MDNAKVQDLIGQIEPLLAQLKDATGGSGGEEMTSAGSEDTGMPPDAALAGKETAGEESLEADAGAGKPPMPPEMSEGMSKYLSMPKKMAMK